MLNLPYYKDLRAVNLLNDDETQEIIKIVWATGYCGGGMRGARRGREGESGRRGREGKGKAGVLVVGSGVRGAWDCAQGRRVCGLGEAPGAVTLAGRDAGRMKALALRRWGGAKAGAKKASEKVENLLAIVKGFR